MANQPLQGKSALVTAGARRIGRAIALALAEAGADVAITYLTSSAEAAQTARDKFYDSLPTVMVMADGAHRDTFVLQRGAYDSPGEKVTTGIPSALPQLPPGTNRLDLARWLVDKTNSLTARVTVNRFWQAFFGTGIVKTVDDFGAQGEFPVHPELLDWLAIQFMESAAGTSKRSRSSSS